MPNSKNKGKSKGKNRSIKNRPTRKKSEKGQKRLMRNHSGSRIRIKEEEKIKYIYSTSNGLFQTIYNYDDFIHLPNYDDIKFLQIKDKNIDHCPILPKNLIELWLCDNFIYELPELPSTIKILGIYNNRLGTLPKLPDNLTCLFCNNNCLEELPDLPKGMCKLECDNNLLTKLPKLSHTELKFIKCVNNKLVDIPELPLSIKSLCCECNKIKRIPDLSEMKYLYELNCRDNCLEQLPNFNPSMHSLHFSNNYIKYLPLSLFNCKCMRKDYLIHDLGPTYDNNPVYYAIDKCHHDLQKYMDWQIKWQRLFVRKIEDWYLECKYNPKYKFCRDRLTNEFNELYTS